MEYVRKLLQETDYLRQLKKLEQLEKERVFCRHGLAHVLDVARIAWIMALEKQIPVEKEAVYLTALLHDVGRIREYQEKVPHHEAGIAMARDYLEQIGYPKEQQALICTAIGEHRDKDCTAEDFIKVIQRADHKSRNCFFCEASGACKWSEELKNRTIEY